MYALKIGCVAYCIAVGYTVLCIKSNAWRKCWCVILLSSL